MSDAVNEDFFSVSLTPTSRFCFASVEDGRAYLQKSDEFSQHMTPLERAARMRLTRPVSEREFLAFVAESVCAWEVEEVRTIGVVAQNIGQRLEELQLCFPETILLVKTSGEEEGQSSYTRGAAIMLPPAKLDYTPATLERLLVHELFHVLSRSLPALREALYQEIGFQFCGEIAFPPVLASRRVTNPDAPYNDHFIHLCTRGQEVDVVPILYMTLDWKNKPYVGTFFDHINYRFLVIERDEQGWRPRRQENGHYQYLQTNSLERFYEQVGRNSANAHQPEEILAENFVALVLQDPAVPSPEVVARMMDVLSRPAFRGPLAGG